MYEYFHFICRPKLVQSITLVSSPLFRKNLGNLREFFLMHAYLIFKELFLIIKRMSMYLFEGSNTPENPQALRILSQLVPSLYVTRSFCLKVRGGTNTAKLDTSTGKLTRSDFACRESKARHSLGTQDLTTLTRFWLRKLTHVNFNHVNNMEAR